ncbi:MAG: glycosyltransferase family 4 protein [Planctomycetota bacterium]|jgi:glycosyltransferase involved in cell wall biosynthesis
MENKRQILQVCRLTHLWGMDLFKEITRAFNPDQFELTTVFLSGRPGDEQYRGYPEYNGKVLFFRINRRRLFWRFLAVWKLVQLLRGHRFEAVIVHHYKPMVLVDIAAKIREVPQRFCVNHDIGNLRTPFRKFFVRRWLDQRWNFITVSDGVKKDLLNAGAGLTQGRIITIYNGIDAQALPTRFIGRPQARADLNLPPNSFVFGNIARLVPRKGHRFLIQAFASIAYRYPDCRLVILGIGHLAAALHELILSEGVADRVIIETERATEAANYLRAFDAFVLPSLVEPFGIVLIEAMAAELPLIASRVDGIPEVVGDAGILVPAADTGALAKALTQVLEMNEKDRKKLAAHAYQRLNANFTIEHYHGAYRRLVRGFPHSHQKG